jgi:hypothetical protein
VRVLGRIVSWVGERAIGPHHLVEVTDDRALRAIKVDRVMKRIEVGHLALQGVQDELRGSAVCEDCREAMERVSSARLDA